MQIFEITTHVENFEKLKEIDLRNFDSVYLGDPTCPEYPDNFYRSIKRLKEGISYLKEREVKAYLSTYAVPRNKDLEWLRDLLEAVKELDIDAVEVHNMGVLRMAKDIVGVPLHVGYFANVYTHETVRALERFGVNRVFLNPELSLDEIQFVNENVESEVVVFAHGKLPLGISEDCFIKEYRKGKCEDICVPMWLSSGKWRLKNIGRATLSGKDWAVIEYLGTFYYRGFRIFYIQGLREDSHYLNRIAYIYRTALEKIVEGYDEYLEPRWVEEISSLSKYGLCNGYLFRRSGQRYIGKLFGGEKLSVRRKEEVEDG